MDFPAPPSPRRLGPFSLTQEQETLVLAVENSNGFTWHILGLMAFTMVVVLVLGVLSTLQAAQFGVTDHGDFFAPKKNHFAFLWLFMTLGLLVVGPLVILRLYKPPLVFRFNARNGTIFRNNELVTRFRRVEAVRIQELKDPDSRYLYRLSLLHTDGLELLIYELYEERTAQNVANELSAYVHRPVRWQ